MTTLSMEKTVGELVAELPARSRIFEKYKIDYCCGGKKTLAEACARKQVSPALLAEELEKLGMEQDDTQKDPASLGFSALIDDIVGRHHAYLREELPRLNAMLEKVTRVHGDKDPRIAQSLEVFSAMRAELESHMLKEEHVLFPAIRILETAETSPVFPFKSIAFPIRAMEHEHDDAGAGLESLSALTDQYTPPDWACNTYRAMLHGLRELEQDLHVHIHKENNILFPRALDLENGLNA